MQKPTSGVSHQGGTRFSTDSLEYSILHRWLEAGAPGPQANSPQVTNLIVTPLDSVVRAPRDSVQLQVLAEFTDGTLADVTALTVFEPSNLVAEVTPSGLVKRLKDGESTIGIRFLEKQLAVRVAFMPRTSRRRIKFPSSQSYIDDLVFAKLKKLGIQPSEVASDSKFIRRAYLDALGILPTGEEAQAFVQDQNPHKRAVIVEALLNRPEFNDRWALIWSDLLRNEEKVLDTKGVEVYHQWIRESFEQRKPLDQFVRELIVASGSTYEVPMPITGVQIVHQTFELRQQRGLFLVCDFNVLSVTIILSIDGHKMITMTGRPFLVVFNMKKSIRINARINSTKTNSSVNS